MGMPNAYRCEKCSDFFSPGTPQGKTELETHYASLPDHSTLPVPAVKNAYKCHHQNCNVYRATVCEIVEHDRANHTAP